MSTLTISAKGQITLRQELLKYLGAVPGQKVDVHKLPGGGLAMQVSPMKGRMDGFIACLTPPAHVKLSLDEINEIAAQGWAKQR